MRHACPRSFRSHEMVCLLAVAQKTGANMEPWRPWEVERKAKTCGLPLLLDFEPHPSSELQKAQGETANSGVPCGHGIHQWSGTEGWELEHLSRDPYVIHLNISLSMVDSLYFGGKSHVSNGQNVSFKEPC